MTEPDGYDPVDYFDFDTVYNYVSDLVDHTNTITDRAYDASWFPLTDEAMTSDDWHTSAFLHLDSAERHKAIGDYWGDQR